MHRRRQGHTTIRRLGPLVCAAALALVACVTSCGIAPVSGAGGSAPAENAGGSRPDAGLVAQFKSEGVDWIRAERERYRSLAIPLSEEDRSELAGYFPREVLDRARVLVVEGFDNPDFFSIFKERGEPYPVDLRRANAMALVDTILFAKAATEDTWRKRLLFHELVHMTQFEVLGLEAYMEGYVDGWARSGRSYAGIPHEQQAFELASKFWTGAEPFSVEAEVRSRFAAPSGAAPD